MDLEAPKTDCGHSKEAETTESPEFAKYRITGNDLSVVKLLFKELYTRYGEHTKPFKYLPLEIVMKTLVGSDDYVGFIRSISDGAPCDICVVLYETHRDCLKNALLEVFPNLTIEVESIKIEGYFNMDASQR